MTWSAGKPKPKTKKRPLPIFDLDLGTDQDARPPKKHKKAPLETQSSIKSYKLETNISTTTKVNSAY